MRRSVALLVFVAACGGAVGSDDPVTDTAAQATTPDSTPEASDTAGPSTTTRTSDATTTTDSGRPRAPDFTLELGDGGSYTLSEGDKPVYMIFWAEW